MPGVLIDRVGRYRDDEVRGVDRIRSLAELGWS
jgi:hypothetical protein